ncbi:MAG: hypothetical protein WCX65_03840 [bacterium]
MKLTIGLFRCAGAALLTVALLTSGCGGGGGGGRGGTDIAPILSLSAPAPNSTIPDISFATDSFYVQLNYSSQDPMQFSSLAVTMKMDSGSAQNITSYFTKVNETTIKSVNLIQFIRTLRDWPTNDAPRTITIAAAIRDYHSNIGGTTSSFIVSPQEAPPPPPAIRSAR